MAAQRNLNPARTRLMAVVNQPFYGEILLNVDVHETKLIPTAGVGWDKNRKRFQLHYNPEFFSWLTADEQMAVLEHELLHIALGHLSYRGGQAGDRLWNVAMDLAINSYVKNLPHNIYFPYIHDQAVKANNGHEPITHDQILGLAPPLGVMSLCIPGDGMFVDYPPFLTSEQYYRLLMEDPKIGQGDLAFDVHGHGVVEEVEGGVSGFEAFEKEAESKRITARAVGKAEKCNSWGNTPAELEAYIRLMLSATIDWKNLFRYFVRKTVRSSVASTWRRANKKMRREDGSSLAPGRRTTRQSKFLVAVDESGSVDNDLMSEFLGELSVLSGYVQFTFLPFDSECGTPWIWKKKSSISTVKRTKCGGTNFSAPTKYFNDHKEYDGLIILTDLCADTPIACRSTRLWIAPKSSEHYKKVAGSDMVLFINPK